MTALVVPDSGPLFTLAAAGRLDLLAHFPLIVTDVVWMETAGRAGNPGASPEAVAIAQALQAHPELQMQQTQVGVLAATHGLAPNLEELSIQEVAISLAASRAAVWVLFEDQWFQRRAAHFPANTALLGTHAFLLACEKLKLIASAAAVLHTIQAAGRNINTPSKALSKPPAAKR